MIFDLSKDDAAVYDSVLRYTSEFSHRGLGFTGMALEGSQDLGLFPVFHFHHHRTEIAVDISFCAAVKGLTGGFTVLLVGPRSQKLDVEEYLAARRLSAITDQFSYQDSSKNIRSFAEGFLQMLLTVFDHELKPLFNSGTFEETPIDWMGYK